MRKISLHVLTVFVLWFALANHSFGQCTGGIGTWQTVPGTSAHTTTSIRLSWQSIMRASGYRVFAREDGSPVFNEVGYVTFQSLALTVQGLLPGKKYWFQIVAVRSCDPEDDLESPSTEVSAWTVPAKTIIRPDQYESTAPNSLTLAWNAQACSIWYINIATDPGFINVVGEYNRGVAPPANNTGVIKATYNDLLPGTKYYYQMRAYSDWFLEGEYSGASPAIATRPETPTADPVVASEITQNDFIARWRSGNGNATKYYMDVAPTNAFTTRLTGYDGKEVSGGSETVPNLVAGSQYYFRVRASSFAAYTTPNSGVVGVRLKPKMNSATNITANTFDVSWVAAQNITDYRLDVSTATNFSSFVAGYDSKQITPAQTTVSGLSSGSVYYTRMRTMLAAVPSEQSNTVKVLTPVVVANPTAVSTTSFQINWTQGISPEGYQLDVATDEAFNNKLSGYSGLGVQGKDKVVAGLTPGVRYFYRLRTVSGSDISANSTTASVYTYTLPPQVKSSTDITTNSFVLNWDASLNATGYRFDVAYDAAFSQPVPGMTDVAADLTTFKVEGLSPGTDYFVRIRSVNPAGASVNSVSINTKTLTPAPVLKIVNTVGTTGMTIGWDPLVGAESYRLDVSLFSDFRPGAFVGSYNNLELPVSSSYELTGLSPGTRYFVRMRAVNAGGISDNSATLAQHTFTLPPTWKDNVIPQAKRITVEWNPVVGADTYELEVSTSSTFATLLPGYDPKIVEASNSGFVVSDLTPLTVYFFRIRARNGAGLSALSLTKSASTANADGSAPTIEMSFAAFDNSFIAGKPARQTLSLSASSPVGALTVDFYHKKRSESVFSKVPLTVAGGKYAVTLEDEWFDAFGMEFYFEVRDLLSQVKREPASGAHAISTTVEQFTIPVARFGKERTNYVIVSFPYVLSKMTIEDLLVPVMGEYNKNAWRFVQYEDGVNKDFQNDGLRLRDVKQGEGYWFLSKDPVTLRFTNGRAYSNSASSPFVMRLRRGWNQIGNPFPFTVSWSDVLEDNNQPASVGNLHVFNGEPNQFPESDELRAFGGGFVFADESTDLVFKTSLPANGSGRMGKAQDIVFEQTPREWFLPLELQQGEITNSRTGIGMSPHALAGKDRLDRVTTPRIGTYLELNSTVAGFEYKLSANVIGPAEKYQWNLQLESDGSESVQIHWDEKLVHDLGMQLLLWDATSNVLIDMSRMSSHTTVPSADIRIIYSKSPSTIDVSLTHLGHAYPNPFRDDVSVPVAYVDQLPVSVTVQITDIAGRVVYRGATESDRKGLLSVSWNGKTSDGGAVDAGLYVYTVRGNYASGEPFFFQGKLIKE